MNNNYKYPNIYSNNTDVYKQQYIEDLLNLNKGKKVSIYQSFNNNDQKTFAGIIEESGKNYIVISDPITGEWHLLLIQYIDFIKFEEDINTLEQFYTSKP